MDWLDYRKKLGLGFDNSDNYNYFKTRMDNSLFEMNLNDYILAQIECSVTTAVYLKYCDMTGTAVSHNRKAFFSPFSEIIYIIDKRSYDLKSYLIFYVAFLNCLDDDPSFKYNRTTFLDLLCVNLKESHIPYELFRDDGGCFIFPKGVEEFDKALVSEPLTWLHTYPKTEKAWILALKSYSNVTPATASNVADLFRKSLETLFQEFFNSQKSLENYKGEYKDYLISHGIPTEISSNLSITLNQYTAFINHHAKHHDSTDEKALEYIMYETGNIMRLLLTLKQQEITTV